MAPISEKLGFWMHNVKCIVIQKKLTMLTYNHHNTLKNCLMENFTQLND